LKIELSLAHFLLLGVAVACVGVGIAYGIYRAVRRLRGTALRSPQDSDDEL